ncbi:hypothetical protein ACFLV4_07335 [Chloroflexota bacterium]
MWKLKACPRCRGDVFLDWEQHVWYEHCLQCGYSRTLQSIVEFRKQKEEKDRKLIRL